MKRKTDMESDYNSHDTLESILRVLNESKKTA